MEETNQPRFLVKFKPPQGAPKRAPEELAAGSIVLGALSEADIPLDDPIVAGRHCRISYEPGLGFRVEDLASTTGLYIGGAPVGESVYLEPGSVEMVLGMVRVQLDLSQDLEQLSLLVKEKSFVSFEAHVKDPDPRKFKLGVEDRLVKEEVHFGRLGGLRVLNVGAGLVGVAAIAAVLVNTGWRETVVDPGPLHPSHAQILQDSASYPEYMQIAAAQGCEACHDPWGATPSSKCLDCHVELVQAHPYAPEFEGAGRVAELRDCVVCHADHRRGDLTALEWDFGFQEDFTTRVPDTCLDCHESEESLDGFQLEKRLPPIGEEVQRSVTYDSFPHGAHLRWEGQAMECTTCHSEVGGEPNLQSGGLLADRREFAPVDFESCLRCHSSEESERDGGLSEFWPGDEFQVDIPVHGTDPVGGEGLAGGLFLSCHTEVHEPALLYRLDPNPVDWAPMAFALRRNPHSDELSADIEDPLTSESCSACHVDRVASVDSELSDPEAFWHSDHLSDLLGAYDQDAPQKSPEGYAAAAQECLDCHQSVALAEGGAPAGELSLYEADECTTCHSTAPPAPSSPDRASSNSAYPHAAHLNLPGGCFACHAIEPYVRGAAPDETAGYRAVTHSGQDCAECHAGHRAIAQGPQDSGCVLCHQPSGDPVPWFGSVAKARAAGREVPSKAWAEGGGFAHFSRGHRAWIEDPESDFRRYLGEEESIVSSNDSLELAESVRRCTYCHSDALEPDQDRISTLSVYLRSMEDLDYLTGLGTTDGGACDQCHIGERQRMHWR